MEVRGGLASSGPPTLEGPYLALQPAGVMESPGPEQLCWILRSAYIRDAVKDQQMDRQAIPSALTRL